MAREARKKRRRGSTPTAAPATEMRSGGPLVCTGVYHGGSGDGEGSGQGDGHASGWGNTREAHCFGYGSLGQGLRDYR